MVLSIQSEGKDSTRTEEGVGCLRPSDPRGRDMARMQEIIADLVSRFRAPKITAEEAEQIAQAIFRYGQMIHQQYPGYPIMVNQQELAYRFREEPARIAAGLALLRRRGQASDTHRRDDWLLRM